MRLSQLFVFSSLCLTPLASVYAQDAESTLPPVIVSASLYPLSPAQVASSVSVITREDIERRNAVTVTDLLRDVPGLTVASNGGPGQTARVLLRGADSRHTLVMIDGVIVNDPSDTGDAFDFAYLSPDNIERIEIIRGPQSTLYGSDAIGGVVSITTLSGSGKPKLTGSAEYGSYHTNKVSGGSSGQAGNTNYSFLASRLSTAGVSAFDQKFGGQEPDGHKNITLSGRALTTFSDIFSTNITARVIDGFTKFDDFGADAPNRANSRQYVGGITGNLSLMDHQWQQELSLDGMHLNRSNVNSFGDNDYTSQREKVQWLHHLKFIANNLISLGASYLREEAKGDGFPNHSVHTNAVFGEDQISITDAFFTTVGLRFDDHSQFGSELTYRITPTYSIASTGTKLKASYGTGFKAPSLYQLYSIFGNTALKPEKSKGYDIGFEQQVLGDFLTFGSSWFHNDIDQMIDYDFTTNHYLNVGHAITKGFESFIALYPDDAWTLKLNHTYLLAEDKNTGQNLVRRPKHQLSFSGDYRISERANIGLTALLVGRRDDFDLSFSRSELPSHSVFSAYANYEVTDHMTLYARLDNLLNKQYEEVYSYGMPGLSAYAGVKLTY